QFNNKFRNNKNIIESVLNDKISDSNFIRLYKPINDKSNKLKTIVNLLLLKQKKEKVILSQEFLMTSYIHMMLNRLFMSKNRVHELVLYDFMRRYYTSEIARNKYIVKTNA
ncbi:hypothetical protein JGH11_18260, partial [Dysgonomonas sp. Marseille-P4677]|uniref:lantibiotic dehydratase C-terminal domain-containing protein n=1 Tax=Dysgonomonas sp. Marseille-P4677 TaxID=2364790 RepID=UPI001913E5B5